MLFRTASTFSCDLCSFSSIRLATFGIPTQTGPSCNALEQAHPKSQEISAGDFPAADGAKTAPSLELLVFLKNAPIESGINFVQVS